jgi:hypothetical protein
MFTRILIIFALVALALWMLRKALGRPEVRPESQATKEKTNKKASPPTLDLVPCKRCGLHLPRNEATWQHGQAFCSKDHAAQSAPGAGTDSH